MPFLSANPQITDISLLQSALTWWEYLDYAATFVVFIGVLGELLAEFTNVFKTKNTKSREKKATLIFTVVLLVGLAGELAALIRTSRLTGQITAILRNDIVAAYKSANEATVKASAANERAAKADLARVQLQERMAWRRLSKEQQTAFCTAIPPEQTASFYVLSSPQDPEAWQYANDFSEALTKFRLSNGFPRQGSVGAQSWGREVKFGVWILVGRKSNWPFDFAKRQSFARRLREKLESHGVSIAGVSVEETAYGVLDVYVGPRLPPPSESVE